MSNKKKKNQEVDLLAEIDHTLDKRYRDLIEEIQFMQADLQREERRYKKKQKKKLKKGGNFYSTADYDRKIRKQLIYQMEGTNFFERVTAVLGELQPVCAIIAKLVMTLIVGILSVDSIKYTIKPQTLENMHRVYQVAHDVSGSMR